MARAKSLKIATRFKRHKRVRAKVFGTAKRPRLCTFKSSKHIYAQLIDDEKGYTLVATSDLEISSKHKTPAKSEALSPRFALEAGRRRQGAELKAKGEKSKEEKTNLTRKVAIAFEVGKLIAAKAAKIKITGVVFDRGGYKYHGRIKALAEGARAGGLKF